MEKLAPEINFEICSYLTIEEQCTLSKTCKALQHVVNTLHAPSKRNLVGAYYYAVAPDRGRSIVKVREYDSEKNVAKCYIHSSSSQTKHRQSVRGSGGYIDLKFDKTILLGLRGTKTRKRFRHYQRLGPLIPDSNINYNFLWISKC